MSPTEAASALQAFMVGSGKGCDSARPLEQVRTAQRVLGVPATGWADKATRKAAARHGVTLPKCDGETPATKAASNADRAARAKAAEAAKAKAAAKDAAEAKRRARAAAAKAKAAAKAAAKEKSAAAAAAAAERKRQAAQRAAEAARKLKAAKAAAKRAAAAAKAQEAAEQAARARAADAATAKAQAEARKASAAAAKLKAEKEAALKKAREAAAAKAAAEARAAEQAAKAKAAKDAAEKAAAEAKRRAAQAEARKRAAEEKKAKEEAIKKASQPTPTQAAQTLRLYLQTKGSNWGTKAKPSPEIRNAQEWMGMPAAEQDGFLGPKTRAAARALGVYFPPASMRGGVPQPTKPVPLPAGVSVENVKALLLDPRPPAGCGLTIGEWVSATPTDRAKMVARCVQQRKAGTLPKPFDTSADKFDYFAN